MLGNNIDVAKYGDFIEYSYLMVPGYKIYCIQKISALQSLLWHITDHLVGTLQEDINMDEFNHHPCDPPLAVLNINICHCCLYRMINNQKGPDEKREGTCVIIR